jgi:hypothetical protein
MPFLPSRHTRSPASIDRLMLCRMAGPPKLMLMFRKRMMDMVSGDQKDGDYNLLKYLFKSGRLYKCNRESYFLAGVVHRLEKFP